MEKYLFTSERLGFRYWEDADLLPFCEMGRDPEVMKYFQSTMSDHKSADMIDWMKQHFPEIYSFTAVINKPSERVL